MAKRMKIAFVGNMNNMPLIYARELRTMGHEVHFYVDAPPYDKLNRPEHRYPEYAVYPSWMIDASTRLSLLSYALAPIALRSLIRRIDREKYDGVVLNGPAVSLGTVLRAPKFAILGGADLAILCDPDTVSYRKLIRTFGFVSGSLRSPIYRLMAARQRKGLRACSGFNYFPLGTHARGDELLDEIFRGKTPFRLEIRGADVSERDYSSSSDRTGDDVVIFIPIRVIWREPLPAGATSSDRKGNDIILRGLAAYMRASGRSPRIYLVEKGPDVEATKDLARTLGISERLNWIPEMPMAEIFEWFKRSDIVFDQLGDHLIGAIALDSMLTGRPVITNARPDIFDPIIPETSPVCHARTPDDVEAWLHRLVDDPGLRHDIGMRSRDYVLRYFSAHGTAEAIERHFRTIRQTPDG